MKSGRCLCGATTFEYSGKEVWMANCHCESCRRATSSPFTSFVGVNHGNWEWTGQKPQEYWSSKTVKRCFCKTCGSQMSYETTELPDEIHFYVSLLNDHSFYKPEPGSFLEERVHWLEDTFQHIKEPAN